MPVDLVSLAIYAAFTGLGWLIRHKFPALPTVPPNVPLPVIPPNHPIMAEIAKLAQSAIDQALKQFLATLAASQTPVAPAVPVAPK